MCVIKIIYQKEVNYMKIEYLDGVEYRYVKIRGH